MTPALPYDAPVTGCALLTFDGRVLHGGRRGRREESGVLVELRISGPELRTLETTWKRTHHPALRVGLRCEAVVDPADGRFRVEL